MNGLRGILYEIIEMIQEMIYEVNVFFQMLELILVDIYGKMLYFIEDLERVYYTDMYEIN